jgi:hypothetical protein
MITGYYYNEQFKRIITQFSSIFAGLQVASGIQEDGTVHMIPVPVRYGSIDRVVASVKNGFTQNKMMTLPIMSTYLLEIELAPERRKGVSWTHRKTTMPEGGVFPQDLKVLERYMPIPYDLTFELAIYASNTDQMFQILEQLLVLFDPILQIQTSDSPYDWARQLTVELLSIGNEENYPLGGERRMIVWNLNFKMDAWMSPPAALKEDLVKQITMRFGNLEAFTLDGYDDNDTFQPYADPNDIWGTTVIDGNSMTVTPLPTADGKIVREPESHDVELVTHAE